MTDPSPSTRGANIGIALLAVAAFALRVVPLLRAGGPLGMNVDYDEGVYFSASALLFRGVLPYRDFVFVHPPGLLYALGITSSLTSLVGVAQAFAAARVVACAVGAANVALAGKVAQRWGGPFAGFLAAALYATYPEVVVVERGPYLEPVLNLACLGAAWVWLSSTPSPRRIFVAGALFAAACAVKVWGGIWLVAALVSLPSGGGRTRPDQRAAPEDDPSPAPLPSPRIVLRFFAGAVLAGVVLVGPLALVAPGAFIDDVLLFHAWRPPDGDVARLPRLWEIWAGRHLACSLLALGGLVLGLVRRDLRASRELRFFGTAYALTVIAFLLPTAYWNQYNAHLAPSEAVLAGWGGCALFHLVASRRPALAGRSRLALLAVALAAFPSLRRSILNSRARAPELLELGDRLRRTVPPGACLFAFEPAWGMAGGFLPPHGIPGAPVIVDPYAAMLRDPTAGGVRYPHVNAAFQSEASQASARAVLERCRFAVLGWRGHWQLSETTQAWLNEHSAPLGPETSTEHYDVWERTSGGGESGPHP